MISIDWGTRIIFVPQSYLTSLGAGLYELDVNQFRLDLKDLEDSEEGMSYPDTHRHNSEVTLSGDIYARTFEIINGYTVTFEDLGGHYTVKCVGANHNIADVLNFNSVNLIIGNSAGLIRDDTSGGSGGGCATCIDTPIEGPFSAADLLRIMAAVLAGKTTRIDNLDGSKIVVFRDIQDSTDLVSARVENSERTWVNLGSGVPADTDCIALAVVL